MRLVDLPCYGGYAAIAVGLASIFGWAAGIDIITYPFPDLPSMSILTAAASVIGGVLLCAFVRKDSPEYTENAELLIWLSVILLALIGLPLFAANTLGVHLGLEDFFSSRTVLGIQTNPVVASFGTLACILSLLVVGVIILFRGKPYSRLITMGAIVLMSVTAIACVGFLFHEPSFYYATHRSSGMSIPTVLVFFFLGAGLLSTNHFKRRDALAVISRSRHEEA